MTMSLKGCKPDNFESDNSLKLSFTSIRGLHSNFVECESFLESNSPDTLLMWDKLAWLNWFWQFFCERLSCFKPKGFCYCHMHVLAVYVKEGLPFARDFSLENLEDVYLCFWLVLLLLRVNFTHSGRINRPGEVWYNDLRWLTFLLGSLIVTLTVPLFWTYLFLLTLVFVSIYFVC